MLLLCLRCLYFILFFLTNLNKTVIVLFGSKAKELRFEIACYRFLAPLIVANLRSKMKLHQLHFFFFFFLQPNRDKYRNSVAVVSC